MQKYETGKPHYNSVLDWWQLKLASCGDVTILVFFISIRFQFDFLQKIWCQFDFDFHFFRQKISYTSRINLGTAMLNYSVEAGKAGDDSERSTTVARLYTRVHMWNSAGTPAWVRINSQMLWLLHVMWEVKPGTQFYISCESNKTVPGRETPVTRRRRPGLTVIIAPPMHVQPQLTVARLA